MSQLQYETKQAAQAAIRQDNLALWLRAKHKAVKTWAWAFDRATEEYFKRDCWVVVFSSVKA